MSSEFGLTAHCQDLGQPRSEPDPGFDEFFIYILGFGTAERNWDRSGSAIFHNLDTTCSELHLSSGFLENPLINRREIRISVKVVGVSR